MRFTRLNTFYRYHIVTAAHVSCPVKYRKLYGDTVGLMAIGERHLSTRLLVPDASTGSVQQSVPLEFRQTYMPNVDVAALRMTREAEADFQTLLDGGLEPLEPDLDPIEEGTKLTICGVSTTEERANPNDDGLKMTPLRLQGTCRAALVSVDYGTVILSSIDEGDPATPPRASPFPLSMCGGPVLRQSSGKCVGVAVARVLRSPPPRDPHSGALYQDPYLDISGQDDLSSQESLDMAFVPIGEFYSPLCRSEM